MKKISAMDLAIFNWVSRLPHPKIARFLAIFIHLITWGGLIYFPFIIYFAAHSTTHFLARIWFYAVAITYLMTDVILKNIIKRPRPYESNPHANPLPFPPLSYSFPSGQSASAATSATILIYFFHTSPLGIVLFISGALLVGIDRIYMRHHYMSDVIAGLVIGFLTAFIIAIVYQL